MILDIRGYRPDDAVNDLSLAFDYAADYASVRAAEDMLAEAKARAERLGNTRPTRGEGQYPLVRLWGEHRLAEANVLLLRGALAEAREALSSYPVAIAARAHARGFCKPASDEERNAPHA